jgi:hypothetical protein
VKRLLWVKSGIGDEMRGRLQSAKCRRHSRDDVVLWSSETLEFDLGIEFEVSLSRSGIDGLRRATSSKPDVEAFTAELVQERSVRDKIAADSVLA